VLVGVVHALKLLAFVVVGSGCLCQGHVRSFLFSLKTMVAIAFVSAAFIVFYPFFASLIVLSWRLALGNCLRLLLFQAR